MEIATNWVVDRIGFAGLCVILFITDTLVTPFPPDILLVVIAKSDLAERWLTYVLILGLVSVVAGMLGWCLGRWLRHLKFFQRLFGQFNEEQRTFIGKYGLGNCAWRSHAAALFGHLLDCRRLGCSRVTVLIASVLFRIPRFILYYLLIASTGKLFG